MIPARHESVHPHIRGVYGSLWSGFSLVSGPSPHTWGLPLIFPLSLWDPRSIPTYVGFTRNRRARVFMWPVHPHIRGVYFIKHAQKVRLCGPSPHTWGLHATGGDLSAIPRSIPTYVGFTSTVTSLLGSLAVHPHIRGVYGHLRLLKAVHIGPSPHTWGLRLMRLRRGIYTPVHPHIRGVYVCFCTANKCTFGPSPHTWGLPTKLFHSSLL